MASVIKNILADVKHVYLKEYTDTEGRTSRKLFWTYILFHWFLILSLLTVSSIIQKVIYIAPILNILEIILVGIRVICLLLAGIVAFVGGFGAILITVRRLHDVGASGYLFFLNFIAMFPVLFVMCLLPSANKDRENPPYGDLGLFEAAKLAFKNFFNFSGRSRRSEYWYYLLFTHLAYFVLSILALPFMFNNPNSIPILTFIVSGFSFILFVPTLSAGVRRLHDTGRSGWWLVASILPLILTYGMAFIGQWQWVIQFLGLVQLIAWVILLYWFVLESKDDNQYGPNPKRVNH